ncbi:OprO/OprP family phosphate-selective porin [Flavobacterium sp. K5-23]|uniref:OprO/OprP family phosphate-selective porin n=1 Tax=Flavobacterium sp. K5-23 TaxID=2746225 RepID=UPI002010A239|nr:OprO/OprP family phosphate-selective porin [Flavobacterium sp. K5-23]UQD54876.1 porin [Flavobacterium sp. K5-23]
MKPTTFVFILLFISNLCSAQSDKLKINLDESGKTYIKGYIRGQFWGRYNDMNPGTTINGEPVTNKFDFSIRRLRMGVTAQLSPKLYVNSLFGGNNINLSNEKAFAFDVLDLNVEYAFSDQFALGMGESSWDGLSRWTTRSSKTLMSMDAPLFSLLTIDKNDDLGRGLGAWAKGQIGKFDYVLSLKNPISFGVEAKEGVTDFALNNPRVRTSAYAKYEFLDNESNKTAYSGGTGTYIGEKKIFNLGAGFLYQAKMTSSLNNGVTKYYDFKNWATELFYDVPLNKEKGTAITSYLGYFDTDFGPNYIRNLGANDYTSGGTSFNGSGNDFPMMGTGNTVFFQFGYLLPKNFLGKENLIGKIQPNIAIQYSNFEALDQSMLVYDIGVNLFFKGHSNKLTLNYQNRPIYLANTLGELKVDERKGQIVLQYQIEIN